MRKAFILVLLTTIGFILAGCANDGSGGPSETPFIGGSNGLIQSFITGAPPEEILDDGQFEFSVITQMENKGEHNIEEGDGYVKIQGILAEDFGLTQSDFRQEMPALNGAKKNIDGSVTNGDITSVAFEGLNYLGSVPGVVRIGRIRVEACYDYETITSTQLCVRERLTTEKGREICNPSGEMKVSNSAGPIQITKLNEQPLSAGKIQVTLQVESVGQPNDRFYKQGTDCQDDYTNNDRYKVFVEAFEISGAGVVPDCSLQQKESANSGYVTLYDGKPQIVTCKLDFGDIDTSFQPLLRVDLKYRYSQYIEKGLWVKDVSVDEE
ncbi:MAG: hypothetical protein V1740_07210 [Candidatus Woesearchaeota archaeon]